MTRTEKATQQTKTSNTTLPRLLLEKTLLFGGRVAMREKYKGIWQEISWNTYLEKVKFFALGLNDLGMQPGETGSILGENCPEWIFADLALQSLYHDTWADQGECRSGYSGDGSGFWAY